MGKETKNNKGCGIMFIVVAFLCLWGFMGMFSGHSFADGIKGSVKALFILVIIGLAIYGFSRLNDKL